MKPILSQPVIDSLELLQCVSGISCVDSNQLWERWNFLTATVNTDTVTLLLFYQLCERWNFLTATANTDTVTLLLFYNSYNNTGWCFMAL